MRTLNQVSHGLAMVKLATSWPSFMVSMFCTTKAHAADQRRPKPKTLAGPDLNGPPRSSRGIGRSLARLPPGTHTNHSWQMRAAPARRRPGPGSRDPTRRAETMLKLAP